MENITSNQTPSKRLIPLTKWDEHHAWPSIGGLRHLRFHANSNGFAEAFVTVGRRVLIDEEKFLSCCLKNNTPTN